MEIGAKVKIKSVPGETLYQRFIGVTGKVTAQQESGLFKVEIEGSDLLFLEASQIEVV